MTITNVALIGGTGTLGAPVLNALKSSEFDIFVLNRQTSKSVYPKTKVITVPDDLNVEEVAKALRDNNIDALVITIAGSHVESQKKLIDAAFKGGVKRVMPAEFGSWTFGTTCSRWKARSAKVAWENLHGQVLSQATSSTGE